MKNLARELIVKPGSKFKLSNVDPGETHGASKSTAEDRLRKNWERLSVLQYLLYAEARRALLVVLQGIDAGGKDGTIRHVMTGMNPQGVSVVPFKVPEGAEKRHDYLWRVHNAVPEYGKIGIFNRSHYEDVVVARVHKLAPEAEIEARYDQINAFERLLAESGTTIVKFFLHISKKEQTRRLQARLDDPTKHWKFNADDLAERKRWDDYMRAYEIALTRCSTPWAPWFIVPADRKWYRDAVVARIVRLTLDGLDLAYPEEAPELAKLRIG
jgi:PPK2 family polyphosphate:nucleotide phosphotransferase